MATKIPVRMDASFYGHPFAYVLRNLCQWWNTVRIVDAPLFIDRGSLCCLLTTPFALPLVRLLFSKYIPADSSKFPSCRKAFINVLASSEEDYDAVVCCNGDSSTTSVSLCAPKVLRTKETGMELSSFFVTDCVFHFDRFDSQSTFCLPVV